MLLFLGSGEDRREGSRAMGSVNGNSRPAGKGRRTLCPGAERLPVLSAQGDGTEIAEGEDCVVIARRRAGIGVGHV